MPFAWGALIGAAGSVISGSMQSGAATDAANTQAASTAAGIAEQRRQYDLNREDFAPYRAAGTQALGQLQTDINTPVTAADVMADPGYQFGLEQGQEALDRRIAASGGRISGAALKAAARFGTDYASTGYGAAYQRKQDRLNRLAALAGIGQTSTGASAAAGANAANNISSMMTSLGDSRAASQIARSNIWGNVGNQLAALGTRYVDRQRPYSGWTPPEGFYGGSGTTLYGDGYGPG